jgi:hypothetical protein
MRLCASQSEGGLNQNDDPTPKRFADRIPAPLALTADVVAVVTIATLGWQSAAIIISLAGVFLGLYYFVKNWSEGLTGRMTSIALVAVIAGAFVTGLTVANKVNDAAIAEVGPSVTTVVVTPTTTTQPNGTSLPTSVRTTTSSEPTDITTTTTEPAAKDKSVRLAALDTVAGDQVKIEPITLGGEHYLDPVRLDLHLCGDYKADYNLGGKYSTFSARIGLSDEYDDTDRPWIFALYDVGPDGNRALFKKEMRFGQVEQLSKIPVDGTIRLRLSIEWNKKNLTSCGFYNSYDAVWANAVLEP